MINRDLMLEIAGFLTLLAQGVHVPNAASQASDLLGKIGALSPREEPACNPTIHWWERTPPRPHDPPGYTAPDALCLCGQHRYSDNLSQLKAGVRVGTFVRDESEG